MTPEHETKLRETLTDLFEAGRHQGITRGGEGEIIQRALTSIVALIREELMRELAKAEPSPTPRRKSRTSR